MRGLKYLFLFFVLIFGYYCSDQPAMLLDEVSKDILLNEYPGNGVMSVRLQSPLYSEQDPSAVCNPTGNEFVQIFCDAETACSAFTGAEKLVCVYDAMKKPMHRYERSMKNDYDHDDDGDKDKVSSHHNEAQFAAWQDVRAVHRQLKEIVHDIKEAKEDDDDHEDHADHDDDSDEEDDDEHHGADYLVNKIQEAYALIQGFKEKYGVANQLKISSKILTVEIEHAEKGWIQISHNAADVNLAAPDLNRLLAIATLEPGLYKAIRVSFGDKNEIQINQGSANAPNWSVYPLLFSADDTRERIVYRDIHIVKTKATDFVLTLDLEKSFTLKPDGWFEFHPVFDVKTVVGDEYVDPAVPATVAVDNGNVTIQTVANSFDAPIRLDAVPVTETALPAPLPGQNSVLLSAYNLQPSMVFKKAVTVDFKYDPAVLAAQGYTSENIRVKYFNEKNGRWIRLNSFTVDPATNTVSVNTNHFTIIAISGQPGFTLNYPKGISGRIQYSALNDIISKLGVLHTNNTSLPNQTQNLSGDGYTVDMRFITEILDLRKFRYNVQGRNGGITVNVRLINSLDIGRFAVRARAFVPGCKNDYDNCISDCNSWWDPVEWICDGGCRTAYNICSALSYTHNASADINLTNFDYSLDFDMNQDPVTGAISYTYIGARRNNISFRIANIYNGNWFTNWVNTILFNFAQAIVNNPATGVGKKVSDLVGPEIEAALTSAMADSTSDAAGIVGDTQGIEFQTDIVADIPEPQMNFGGTCMPNFPAIPDQPIASLNLPAGIDIGLGLSTNALRQVFNEMANRGNFCFSQMIDPATQTRFSMEPTAPPTVEYLGNYIFRMRLPVNAKVTSFGNIVSSENGNFDMFFRLKININDNSLGIGAVKVLTNFQNQNIQNGMTVLTDAINTTIANDPSAYGFNLSMSNPMNYAGFQSSMFRMEMVEEKNGVLTFGIDIRGLRPGNAVPNPQQEWIWTKNHNPGVQTCSLFSEGTVVQVPGTSSYAMRLTNGAVLPLVNAGINSGKFASIVGTTTTLQGYCRPSISWTTTSIFGIAIGLYPVITTKYYATNIVDDHFYMHRGGYFLPKGNSAVQALTGFTTTIGLHEINVTGNDFTEILQVKEPAQGVYKLNWVLTNFLDSAGNANQYEMDVPPEIQAEGLYRVSVVQQGGGYDQVMLNCNVYNVNASATMVTLQLAHSVCQDPYAGVVIDSANSLMWTKCSIGQEMYDPDCAGLPEAYKTISQSSGACSILDVGGYNDWRLPNRQELMTSASTAYQEFPGVDGYYWISDPSSTYRNLITAFPFPLIGFSHLGIYLGRVYMDKVEQAVPVAGGGLNYVTVISVPNYLVGPFQGFPLSAIQQYNPYHGVLYNDLANQSGADLTAKTRNYIYNTWSQEIQVGKALRTRCVRNN